MRLSAAIQTPGLDTDPRSSQPNHNRKPTMSSVIIGVRLIRNCMTLMRPCDETRSRVMNAATLVVHSPFAACP